MAANVKEYTGEGIRIKMHIFLCELLLKFNVTLDTFLDVVKYTFFLSLFIYFFKFYFIFKLYIIVLVLPNIEMNPPDRKSVV